MPNLVSKPLVSSCFWNDLSALVLLQGRASKKSRARFQPSGLAFPGLDAPVPSALRRDVERCLAPVVKAELGMDLYQLPASSAASFLRVLTTPSSEWTSSQLFPHIDYAASVAATVGLNDFSGTSVGFYAARAVEARPLLHNLRDVAKYKLHGIADFAAEQQGRKHEDGSLSKHFDLLLEREVRTNRALAYPAWLLHRAQVPKEAASRLTADPERGRLTLNLFYTSDDHVVRKGEAPAAEPSDAELRAHLRLPAQAMP
eukprot:gb/GFBE01025804.1/.p1 GENE.gb/GFBE01025804.1/~~gb/GFBE01025804.1/.p1  ORF type:complete len:258 (+),score=30.70 gb/GFBE01025804.1/:1-774(+)